MALTRKFLIDLGIEKDQIQGVLDEHGNTVELIKEKAREDAEKQVEKLNLKIASLREEIDNAPGADGDGSDWKSKYELLKGEFETFKQDAANKEILSTKRSLAKKALLDSGVTEDILEDFMLSALDYEAINLKDGAINEVDKFVAAQKERYGKYFGEVRVEGAFIANPPASGGGEVNPWKKGEHYSLQKQTELFRKDPAKARQMAAVAGIKL